MTHIASLKSANCCRSSFGAANRRKARIGVLVAVWKLIDTEPVISHWGQKVGRDRIARARANHRINATTRAHGCLAQAGIILIDPPSDGRWREYLAAMETTAHNPVAQ